MTVPVAADLTVVVDDVAGTPTTKKITLQNLLTGGSLIDHSQITSSGTVTHAGIETHLTNLDTSTTTTQGYIDDLWVSTSTLEGYIYDLWVSTATLDAELNTFPTTYVNITGDTMTGNLVMGDNDITGGNVGISAGTGDFLTSGTLGAGAITGTSLTDGVATLSSGNLTDMGNITGSDVDISAGTGDYTGTGDITLSGATSKVEAVDLEATGTLYFGDYYSGTANSYIISSGALRVYRAYVYSDNQNAGGGFQGYKGRGTSGAPTNPWVDDNISIFSGNIWQENGLGGGTWKFNSRLTFRVDGTVSPTAAPSRLGIDLIAPGSNTLTEYYKFHAGYFHTIAGDIRFGNTISATGDCRIYQDGSYNLVIDADYASGGTKLIVDTILRVNDAIHLTQTDGNEFIDSLNDGYMDYGATIRHRFNAPISVADKTLLGSPVAGTFEFDNDRMYLTNVATQRAIDRTSDVIVADTTVVNTTTETPIFTASIPANSLKAGNVIVGHTSGELSNNSAADDITIRLKFGGSTLVTFNPAIGNVTGEDWHFSGSFTTRTTGAAGTYAFHGHVEISGNPTTVSTTGSVDTTGSNDFTVTVEWDNAKADNTFSIYQGYVTYKN